MRCFLGIKLSNFLKDNLYNFAKNNFDIEGIKIIPKENIHITVKFLGDIDNNKIEEINNIDFFNKYNNTNNKIKSPVKSLGIFSNYKNIKIIWIGVPKLTEFLKETDEKLNLLGFKKERNYIPHITICRVKYIKNNKKELIEKIEKYKNIDFGNIAINNISLFKSELTPNGAKYNILKEYSLKDN